MRSKIIIVALILATSLANGKDLNAYQDANLEAMNLVACGADSKSATKLQDQLCPEYTLQTDQVVYSIRPVDQKHPALLPVGVQAKFRMQNTTLIVRVPSLDSKERKFSVVSVRPLGENSADNRSARLNHLQ